MTATESRFARHLERLNRPADAAGLAAFRIAFGALMVFAVVRFVARGWVKELYLDPAFHFTYFGFEWVRPWPAWGMALHFALMGLAAFGMLLGVRTRLSALVFFVTFTYAELIDKTTYLNHYYLVSLLALLLVFVPAGAMASIDAARGKAPASVRSWAYTLLRLQVGLVYVFAGLAKLNADWLADAEPLTIWLQVHADVPLVGRLLADPLTAQLMSYAGAAFDLSIVPLLLWKRTRRAAYAAALLFHVSIWLLFPVGVFSWVMLVSATVFFDPSWPRRWLPAKHATAPSPRARGLLSFGTAAVAAAYVAIQILVPLRFLAYPGNVNWTEEAFRFAWRVMLIEKSGSVEYRVHSERGESRVLPRSELTPLQYKMMSTDPDMIHEYALYIAARRRAAGENRVQVFADAYASLNGRPGQRLVDPEVDLASIPRSLAPQSYIVPLASENAKLEHASTASFGFW
jgi:vitamin K-dependent gamma-carboxylase